ncbi:MAG: ABC transporter ATP-binding protein [Phycisphaerae bacterium]|nr:ABC transporter ATP-binding protein [Phycisphaerae bacterium]
MIKIKHVTGTYKKGTAEIKALDDLTLDIAEGEFAAVQGPSGSGKTTLLMILGGMLRPAAGQVTIQDQDIYALSTGRRNRFRAAQIGFVFQMFHLVPYLSVFDNVMLAAVKLDARTRSRAQRLLDEFGLGHRSTHRPEELSTGERQRTAMARALLNDPPLILADEPTGNLDPENAGLVLDHLGEIHKTGRTLVVVTHGHEAERFATQHICLRQGRLA